MESRASLGQIVHYVAEYPWSEPYPIHLAAIVTGVDLEGVASLHVFDADGQSGRGRSGSHDRSGAPGTWHLPEECIDV
jgi:hypothetical protein